MTGSAASITACVVARDEAGNLEDLLPTLRWADELLVLVDDASVDGSAQVAAELADRAEVRRFGSFAAFRNAALALAACPWILFVDADERVSDRLVAEVRAAAAASADRLAAGETLAPIGYWVPRRNVIFGRLMAGGGWWPDYQLRLLRVANARYDEARLVHEVAVLDGEAGHLAEPLLHLSYCTPGEFIARQRRYTDLEAHALAAGGAAFRRRSLVGQPVRELARRYVSLGGWRDGPVGLFLCLAMAYFVFKRVRLTRKMLPPGGAPPSW